MNNNLYVLRLEKEGESPIEAQGPYAVLSELAHGPRSRGYKVVLKKM